MDLPAFSLERWFAEYEFNVELNLCASCAGATTSRDLLGMAGDRGLEKYLSLGLDYIPSEGTSELREAISRTYNGLRVEDIRVTTGASEAIFLLMNVLLKAGDEVIVQSPVYQSLYSIAQSMGCKVSFWRGTMEQGFLPSIDELETLITGKTRAIIINSPNSPTGAVFPRKDILRLVDIVERKDLFLISDEVYRGLVFDDRESLSPVELSEKAISIGDMTKPFGLGGLRVGWVACRNPQVLNKCGELRDYTTMCCAAPSEFLAVVALNHREEILEEKIRVARINLDRFGWFVSRHEDLLQWVPPQGGVSAFPRLKTGVNARDFCTRLVEEQSVLLLPGDVFHMPEHFRIGFGMEPERFEEGLARIESFFAAQGN